MRSVALDLGKRVIEWCEVERGEVRGRGRVRALEELLGVLGPGQSKACVAFEACRESRHVHDVVQSWGQEPVVVDTTRVRAMGIGSHGRKNDRLDCEVLARALEQGHVARAHVLSDRARELRELAEQHRALTETRKRLIIHARGLARGRGWDVPECEPGQFADKLARQSLPEPYSKLLVPLLAPLQSLEPEIAAVDLRIQECAAAAPGSTLERLASVPGVSVLVASAVLSVLDDATRFHRACEVAAYFGLCPSEHSTGGKQRLGSITKRGNAYARWMLVQSAWCILRSRSVSDPLVRWAQRTAARRGRMRAAVAVARRLVRILWALWRDGTFYDPEQLRWEQARRRADQNNEPPTQADRTAQQQRAQRQAQHKLLRQQRTHQRTLHNHDLEVTHS